MPVCAGICLIISIHAPRMGSDDIAEYRHYLTLIFQSTLPGWGATCPAFVITRRTLIFQSTLPGWGATCGKDGLHAIHVISIHAPRMGSDVPLNHHCAGMRLFQSTLPGWGATGDFPGRTQFPYGFQSTLPGWGATYVLPRPLPCEHISIHAPRMGSDFTFCHGLSLVSIFQSTLPGWGATRTQPDRRQFRQISIHAPRMGSDWEVSDAKPFSDVFQSTLPGWGATLISLSILSLS